MNKFFCLAGACLVMAFIGTSALPGHKVKRQDSIDYPEQDADEKALGLPSAAKSIRPSLSLDFSCEGRAYGYYADVANDCQVFHVCYPVTYADGNNEVLKWSFICPNQTIFDQSNLVCSFPLDALPCEEAPKFYSGPESINSRFGIVDLDA